MKRVVAVVVVIFGKCKNKYGVHHSILNIGRKCGTENLTIEKKMKKKEREIERRRE